MGNGATPGWIGAVVGAGIAASATAAGYWWNLVAWLGDFETLAAWVQAFGSIAAILWGVWLFRQDNVMRAAGVRSREVEFGRSFTEIVSIITAQLRGAERISQHRDLRDGSFSEVTFDRLRFVDEIIAAFPADALADARLVREAITARSRVGQAVRRCKEFNVFILQPESDHRTAELDAIRTQISRLRQYMEADEEALRQRYPGVDKVTLDL
jgi:hypothetical protein